MYALHGIATEKLEAELKLDVALIDHIAVHISTVVAVWQSVELQTLWDIFPIVACLWRILLSRWPLHVLKLDVSLRGEQLLPNDAETETARKNQLCATKKIWKEMCIVRATKVASLNSLVSHTVSNGERAQLASLVKMVVSGGRADELRAQAESGMCSCAIEESVHFLQCSF